MTFPVWWQALGIDADRLPRRSDLGVGGVGLLLHLQLEWPPARSLSQIVPAAATLAKERVAAGRTAPHSPALGLDPYGAVYAEEAARIQLLKKLLGKDHVAEFFYMAYLGFLVRRRRVPQAVPTFSILVNMTKALLVELPTVPSAMSHMNDPES